MKSFFIYKIYLFDDEGGFPVPLQRVHTQYQITKKVRGEAGNVIVEVLDPIWLIASWTQQLGKHAGGVCAFPKSERLM